MTTSDLQVVEVWSTSGEVVGSEVTRSPGGVAVSPYGQVARINRSNRAARCRLDHKWFDLMLA